MSGLMDRTEKRRGLQKAGDADTDPASINASENTSEQDGEHAVYKDSDHDIANEGDPDSDNTGYADSADAVVKDSDSTVESAVLAASHKGSDSTGDRAGVITSSTASAEDSHNERDSAADSASEKAGTTASRKGAGKGSVKARDSSGRKTGTTVASKTGNKPRRGVGRPPGPPRQAITVRVLSEHDAKLTQAWNQEGMRPQQVIDQALSEWFERHLNTTE